MIDVAAAWQILREGGTLGLTFLLAIGGARGWYVFGWTYRALERDRDYWRQLALSGTSLAQASLQLAKEKALSASTPGAASGGPP